MRHELTLTDKILAKTLLRVVPLWVTPNIVSWLRLVSIPFIAYLFWTGNYSAALPLFFISAFSDAVDGSLARTRNLVTKFGKMFDPFADKLLIGATALIIIPRYLDWGIVIAMVLIDLILISSAYIRHHYSGKIIQSENAGKLKMITQSLGLGALLIYAIWHIGAFLLLAQYLFYIAIFFALISLVVYRAI